MRRWGHTYQVVRVNGDRYDTYAAETLTEAVEIANADKGATLECCEVHARDAGAARLMGKRWKHFGTMGK